ncbi:TetR family transcriptional regulator [Murinocardiopsis flavida]|uniref:TetR family transcriptional regulator n=1 Tax=Murinocardiopsis flavida TaxID=645275 RepID=A0A2P8D6T7_9ACTN|nr:TetR/AcrR family transcriptional regulator [Murinocardiopsis flavida]PSK92917.1 TetR family transcriptional regulator [Murinocardiopsis flavida]
MGTTAANTRGSSAETRDRLIDAAGQVLRQEGYAKASARTIAAAAGVNSALVFYHFGGVDPLLLAALDRSSEERMLMHRPVADAAHTVEQLVEAAVLIYRADVEGGHLTLFTELVAASVNKPELRPEINRRADMWLEFIEQTWERVAGGTPLGRMLPAREVAYGAITFYLGVNLFSVLDEDDSRTEAVFALAGRMAPRAKLLTMRLPGTGRGRGAGA